MKRNYVLVLLLLVLGVVPKLCEGKHALVCRVSDPSVLNGCDIRQNCWLEVYPVETAQSLFGVFHTSGTHNKLFALYGGPNSCGYFGNLINTCKGRQTLVETVKIQLQKSSFRGVELQCDPVQSQLNQQDYSDFITLLRKEIGGGYIISVFIQSVNIETCVVNVLNNVVDLVSVPFDGCEMQVSVVQNLIAHGLNRQKILLDVPLPAVVKCPLDSGPKNLFSLVEQVVNGIRSQDLLGATLQVDRDDTAGVCAKGRFPLFKHLNILLKSCGASVVHPAVSTTGGSGSCNFKGYVRDTRDCSSFYSCNNGVQHQFQCPQGLAFDTCSSTCKPVLQVKCDDNSCTLTGAVNGGCNHVPFPIPYPFPFPWGQYNNGSNHSEPCLNITTIQYINNQTSEFIKLLERTNIDGIIGVVNELTGPLQDVLGKILGGLEILLKKLLFAETAIGGTMGQMDEMNRKMNLLEELLIRLLQIFKDVLGINPGVLTGLLGGGDTGAISGLTGGGTGGVGDSTAVAGAVAGAVSGAVGAGAGAGATSAVGAGPGAGSGAVAGAVAGAGATSGVGAGATSLIG
ncbi:uncharacterized protein LOC135711819 [Ochlerotatus camptorhynchus]|uniref:uncharacterized protein LOC135711819 n=1 Tax=Ochlerotatus camptorhynchus TaxID=644619 RepID=UPI0031D550AB